MPQRKTLIALIVAELTGILLLVLLYLIFRAAAPAPVVKQTPVALAGTRVPIVTFTPRPVQPINSPIATPAPVPTARVTQYTVAEGDTLWGIAVNFHLSLDELVAANPAINPDRLYPGDIVNVPEAGTVDISSITRQPTAPASAASDGVTGVVKPDTGGLRLRKGPSINDDVITKLPDATTLKLIGRTADNAWLQVTLSEGTQGWVMALYVDISGNLAKVAVTSSGQAQASSGNATPASRTANLSPLDEPYISGITSKSAAIFKAGQAMGNRANVFALVGDSNTQNPAFLQPLDRGDYNLAGYLYLQDSITFFKGSFARSQSSPAAVGGFNTTKVLDPANASSACTPGESPLVCEYRITKPAVALILLGTGDQHTWQGFEGRYRIIIQYTIDHGIIPVLITKGDDLESRDNSAPYGYINGIIARLSREYDVPLLDLRQAVYGLPNHGFNPDGFHYNTPPDGHSAYFLGDWLKYGYTIRNLTALQMLDALRRQVLSQ